MHTNRKINFNMIKLLHLHIVSPGLHTGSQMGYICCVPIPYYILSVQSRYINLYFVQF